MLRAILIIMSICYAFAQSNSRPDYLAEYDISAKHPFGRYNPDAPKELKQFEFMVGQFNRTDSLFDQKSGKWQVFKNAEWNASYVMNGHAILDQSFNAERKLSTSNMRTYDSKTKKWVISWWSSNSSAKPLVSEGAKEGDRIIIRNIPKTPHPSGAQEFQYIFYDISDKGYRWLGQAVINGQGFPFWKITCTRKR